MRLSEFWRRMDDEFGSGMARHLASSVVLAELDGRTADEALEAGESPRTVWEALCRKQDVPHERWFGKELPLRTERWDG